MSEIHLHQVPESAKARAHITRDDYLRMYRNSIEQPEPFWAEQAQKFLDWFSPWSTVSESVIMFKSEWMFRIKKD